MVSFAYPLSLPTWSMESLELTPVSRVGASASPFTGQQQVFVHQGKWWQARVLTLRDMPRADAEAWISFLVRLNGREGTFLLGDPTARIPRGSAGGAPVVDGADQTGQTLATRGWPVSTTGVLLPGDFLQVDTGANARLYKVLSQVDSDAGGLATIDVWPSIRDKPADGIPIATTDTVGLFRLASNENGWRWRAPTRTQIEFEAVEAI